MNRFKLKTALAMSAVLLAGAGAGAPAEANSLAGQYLAAKAASARSDYEDAAAFYAGALARDPGNDALRDRAMTFKLLNGDLRGAALLAELLVDDAPQHQLAGMTLAAADILAGDFAAARERLGHEESGVSELVAKLLLGWIAVGERDVDAMRAAFDSLGDSGLAGVLAGYHRGLALAALGDLEGARGSLSAALEAGASRDGRPALALGAVLELLDRPDEARKLYEEAAGSPQGVRSAQAEIDRMDAGEPASLPVRTASSGAAEALFNIAAAVGSERNASVALLYARMALALRPELHAARLLAAGLLDEQDQHDAAAEIYQRVPRKSPLFVAAELGRSQALIEMDKLDDAVILLDALAREHPEELDAQLSLAMALRRAERWPESAAAYDAAIALIDPIEPDHWTIFYQRGIAHERAGDWEDAEADFKRALELEPNQPLVMNYLGYSWVEMGRNLDEAQAMIEQAVAQREDDGYIVDSLGWVLYRIDKFDEAVPHLERAVELMPTDPIINDHLGDALWMVGRKREAAFQWRRALSFEPDEKDADRIRRKLDDGLDIVLKEETAAAAATKAVQASGANDG